MEKPLKISDLVKATGLSRTTIHYYTRENLLSEPIKTARTMAYYTTKHIAELEEIVRLKEAGYPLSFIKKMTVEARAKKKGQQGEGEDPEKIKSEIVEKAVDSFAGIGYYATDMNDVARSAGIDEELIYLYFPDKGSLFVECVDHTFQAVFKEVWDEVKDEKDPLTRIYKSALFILEYYSNFADLLHELDQLSKTDEKFAVKRKEFFESASMLLKSNLLKAYELGLLGPLDMDIVSHFCIGVAEGGARFLDMEPSSTPDDYLQTLLALFELAGTKGVAALVRKMKKPSDRADGI